MSWNQRGASNEASRLLGLALSIASTSAPPQKPVGAKQKNKTIFWVLAGLRTDFECTDGHVSRLCV